MLKTINIPQTAKIPFQTRYCRFPSQPFVVPADEKSKSVQSLYPVTTIKYHLDRFKRTGIWGDPLQTAKMRFADVSNYPSFADIHTKLSYAKSLYQSLSPSDKQQFASDIDFVRFLTDEGNKNNEIWKEAQKILSDESDGDLFAFGESLPVSAEENSEAREAASDEVRNDSAPVGDEVSE